MFVWLWRAGVFARADSACLMESVYARLRPAYFRLLAHFARHLQRARCRGQRRGLAKNAPPARSLLRSPAVLSCDRLLPTLDPLAHIWRTSGVRAKSEPPEASVLPQPETVLAVPQQSRSRNQWRLFLASFLALYFELVVIRYLSTEVRVFAYLMNLPLIASFVGLGLGMMLGGPPRRLNRAFPFAAVLLFLLIAFAPQLRLTHLPFPTADYFVWTTFRREGIPPLLLLLEYLSATLFILSLVVAFFVGLGGIVGRELSRSQPLAGYAINLMGSLAGILAFTVLCYLGLPPAVWLAVGFATAIPFLSARRGQLLSFVVVILAVAANQGHALWSPYYRIDLSKLPPPEGWSRPSAYLLSVNHDYHQKMVDLSPAFVSSFPAAEPNRSALSTYELPYQLVAAPGEVLVVGAGTGNDVAAALRHGAGHIDAVEIDPLIYKIGAQYHPENPYRSPRVSVFLDDARAFLKKTRRAYDLIVFGYLDSHTLLTSFSSVRLDNYVYTVESFGEAREHLRPGGSLVLAFAAGKTFVTERLFAGLTQAFGVPPQAYDTGYDTGGVVFLEGPARNALVHLNFPDITAPLLSEASRTTLATDRWPFLYLQGRTVPASILWVLVPFLLGCLILIDKNGKLPRVTRPGYPHLFFLGAGFLLLETSGVTRLSLLFGSTWVVNAVVIGAFIAMAFLANAVIMRKSVPHPVSYAGLFASLGLSVFFPYPSLSGLAAPGKVLAAAVIVGLPVFFSGLVFSSSFRDFERPSEALGVNILGAVMGGALENSVMIGGTQLLGWLALCVYGLSAVFRKRPPTAASQPVERTP